MSDLQVAACPHCNERMFHDGSIAGRTVVCPHCKDSFQIPVNNRWHHDPPRTLRDESTGFECELYGQAPVQAHGRVRGHPFYFRAKWSHWDFTVCVNADIDASCIQPKTDEPGFFDDREYRGFYLGGEFNEASYMRYDAAEAIMRNCVRQFLEALEKA